ARERTAGRTAATAQMRRAGRTAAARKRARWRSAARRSPWEWRCHRRAVAGTRIGSSCAGPRTWDDGGHGRWLTVDMRACGPFDNPGAVTCVARPSPAAAAATTAAAAGKAAAAASRRRAGRAHRRADGFAETGLEGRGRGTEIARAPVAPVPGGMILTGLAAVQTAQCLREALRPLLLHAERDRERQVALEECRRELGRITRVQVVLLRDLEVLAEAGDVVQDPAAESRRPPHGDGEEENGADHAHGERTDARRQPAPEIGGNHQGENRDEDGGQVHRTVDDKIAVRELAPERALVPAAGMADPLVIPAGELQRVAVAEQRIEELLLAPCQRRCVRGRLETRQHVPAVLVDPEPSLDREIDDRRGHRLIVIAHPLDVAQRRRGESFRRLVARNDEAGLRIAAVPAPHGNVVREQ